MQTITATNARANLFKLMDSIAENHEPVLITGRRSKTVMISEEEWRGIQETIYLSSIPGMVESIVEARKEPIEERIPLDKLEW